MSSFPIQHNIIPEGRHVEASIQSNEQKLDQSTDKNSRRLNSDQNEITCPNCGCINISPAKYCSECGAKISIASNPDGIPSTKQSQQLNGVASKILNSQKAGIPISPNEKRNIFQSKIYYLALSACFILIVIFVFTLTREEQKDLKQNTPKTQTQTQNEQRSQVYVQASNKTDIVSSFVEGIKKAAARTNDYSEVVYKKNYASWHRKCFLCKDIEYDLKKTESIINPYIGLVEVKITLFENKSTTQEEAMRSPCSPHDKLPVYLVIGLTYHHSNGTWQLKNADINFALEFDNILHPEPSDYYDCIKDLWATL